MGWLDVIGVGIDAAQYYQLSKMRGQMQDTELDRLTNARRMEVIEAYRNVVFGTLKSGEALEDHLEASPQPVYVGAELLHRRLEIIGISTETFPEFADKEYVQKTFSHLQRIREEAGKKLSGSQVTQSEECVAAIVDMPSLDRAIELQESHSELKRVEDDFKVHAKKRNRSTIWALLGMLGAPTLACIGCVGATSILGGSASGSIGSTISRFVMVGMAVLALAGVGYGAFIFLQGGSPEYKELSKDRQKLKNRISELSGPEDGKPLPENQSLEQLQEVKRKKEHLIRSVMGQIENYDQFLLTAE
jgi:hypothetical protein